MLPERPAQGHKGDGGKVLIIGGGTGFYGAGLLSALAATRCGAGYTHLMTDLSKFPWLKFPDFIVHEMKAFELKKFNPEEIVVGFGPGAGVNQKSGRILQILIKKYPRVILDADALTILAQKPCALPADWIVTPHEGELARLMQTSSKAIHADRLEWTKKAQERFGCVVLLKGAETIMAGPKQLTSIKAGTPALAKAGTGDVLLGMIAAFYAQGLSPLEAAVLGAYVHGQAARRWEKAKRDHLSLRPLDLIEILPQTLCKLRQGSSF